MEAREQVLLLLDQYKCPLIRKGKHDIYRLPTGKPYVLPSSPSDYRSWKNNLADLKVELGLSTRGQEARVGEFEEKRAKPRDIIRHHDWVSPAASVPSFNFGEKVRAALTGKPLEREVVESHPVVKDIEVPVKRRYNTANRRPSPGPVKQWTKEEIDAANSALKAGHYTEYIRRYDESNQPMQKPKQEAEVLTVEQIRYTIGELEREVVEANKAADKEKKESDLLLAQSEELMRQSSLALDKQKAILDKANSFQDVINSLEIIISDLERVRPMMGLLNREKPVEKERVVPTKKNRRGWGATKEVIFYLIKRSALPVTPAEIYRELKQIEGYENFARNGVYNFLAKHSKPGCPIIRVSEGLYTFKKEAKEATENVNKVLEKFAEEPDRKTG
jgi:hypothetical protein